jgi:hypothetical protein
MKLRLPIPLYVVVTVAAGILSACTFVRPQDAALMDAKAANALAMSAAVATRPDVPQFLKDYTKSDANTWTYFSDWGNGRAPTTQP